MNQKSVAKYEANNAAAAARILRNRDAEPVALVLWAEAFQKHQESDHTSPQRDPAPVEP